MAVVMQKAQHFIFRAAGLLHNRNAVGVKVQTQACCCRYAANVCTAKETYVFKLAFVRRFRLTGSKT